MAIPETRGRFEAHLTVEAAGAERRAAFAALCAELGVKCVLIELARGAHPAQPMTSSHHTGELAAVMHEVHALRDRLVAAGFPVARVKLEAEVTNDGVAAASPCPPGTYFEFHAKLRLPADFVDDELRALCVDHHAHLSRNDFERDATGAARFVTLRVYEAGRDRATAEWARLVDALVAAGHEIAATKAELTVHDSGVELDAGWLP